MRQTPIRQVSGFLEKISKLTAERSSVEKSNLSAQNLKSSIESGVIDLQPMRTTFPLSMALRSGTGLITEIKRASPSQGMIAPGADASRVAGEYLANGASALSVLTEPSHFGGSIADLQKVRKDHPNAVILMKDFVIDPYQIYQARYFGADVVLLIVAMLEDSQLRDLHALATELGLSVLVEVHDAEEFEVANSIHAPIIGINNRNLKTLTTDLSISKSLIQSRRPNTLLVAESGIEKRETIDEFRNLGFEGFLVGTSLMREASQGLALRKLVSR